MVSKNKLILLFLFFIVITCAWYFLHHITLLNMDDFTKDLFWSAYGSYAKMYPLSYFKYMHFNPWFGYDVILGYFRNLFGAYFMTMVIPTLFGIAGFIALIYSFEKSVKIKYIPILSALIIIEIFNLWSGRLSESRPEILVTILMIFALGSESLVYAFIWNIVSAFLYSLFWFYSPIVIIVQFLKKQTKLAFVNFLGFCFGLAFWIIYAKTEYFKYIWMLVNIDKYRHGIIIQENLNSIYLLFSGYGPIVIVLVLLFFVLIIRDYQQKCNQDTVDKFSKIFSYIKNGKFNFENCNSFALAAIIALPLYIQARYAMSIFYPLAGIFIASKASLLKIDVNEKEKKQIIPLFLIFAVVVVTLIFYSYRLQYIEYDTKLPKNSKVIVTNFTQAVFALPYIENAKVKIIPSCEIGFNQKQFVESIKHVSESGIVKDEFCQYMKQNNINYVLSMLPVHSSCLKYEHPFAKIGNATYSLYTYKVR